jgi:hypothetical protein
MNAPNRRTVAWAKDSPFGVEFAEVVLERDRLSAVGVAIGTDPATYRLDYILETGNAFVTQRLDVTTRGQGWRRRLELRRSPFGVWSAETEAEGEPPLPPPGGDTGALSDALDCDLALSPLTNSMPVLRNGLLNSGGPIDFRMAWVSVPDLGVHPSDQRYTFLRRERGGHTIRYESGDRSFVADVRFDHGGVVMTTQGSRALGRSLEGQARLGL